METSPEGDIKRRYLRGSSLVAQQIAGSLQYYLHNAHGDVVQRMGENGNNAPRYRYDAFGNEPDACRTDANPWRYCGEYRDAESGEYYLRTRSYNPETGRFTSEDIAKSGTNWYAYCDGDPVQYVDPTGMYGTGADAGSSYEDWWKKTYGGGGGTTSTTTSGSTDVGDAARENIASGGANLDGTVIKAPDVGGAVAAPDTPEQWPRSLPSGINAPDVLPPSTYKKEWDSLVRYFTNTDEKAVLDGGFLTFCKGVPVIKAPFLERSGSFGAIFLGKSQGEAEDIRMIQHEWGHTQQLAQLGPIKYLLGIGIPSFLSGSLSYDEYYAQPWEVTADLYGGVDRGTSAEDIAAGIRYLEFLKGSPIWGVPITG